MVAVRVHEIKENGKMTIEKQIEISDLAEKYLDEAIEKGDSFSEGLSNWAMNKAMQEIWK